MGRVEDSASKDEDSPSSASRDSGYESTEESNKGEQAETSSESHGFSDMLRKAMAAGLGSVFMSEGGVRALVKDLKLPKDVVGFMMGQAERSKAELSRVVGDELRRFFEGAALRSEISKLLSDVVIEVRAEIRLQSERGGPEVKVKSASVRRERKG